VVERVTGSIYSADPGVDRNHLIIQRKYTLYLSQLLVSLALSVIWWIYAIPWDPQRRVVVLATGPGLNQKKGSVQFQNHPKTGPVASWRSKPSPVPVNSRVSPGLDGLVGSNLRLCISGCSIYGCIQIFYG